MILTLRQGFVKLSEARTAIYIRETKGGIMKSKRTIFFCVLLVLVLCCAPVLTAFSAGQSESGSQRASQPIGKDVSRPENIFTNDLDIVDSENLAAEANVTASSAASSAANLTDGNKDTVWTAESTDGEYFELSFSSPVEINTIVLRENGNYITGFRFFKGDGKGGWQEFYRQDRVERYRYCTFDAVTLDSLRITFDGANEGYDISLSEVEIYDVAPKTYAEQFKVFSYYNVGDFRSPALDENELAAQLDVVTDVILFEFVYWDSEGDLTFTQSGDSDSADPTDPSYLKEAIAFIKKCGGKDINICVDILPADKSAHGLPACSDALVKNLAALVDELGIDGVEFDWEYPSTPAEWRAYGDMMLDLKAEIGDEGKYVSVALSNFNVGLERVHIEGIDYVQIMGYDRFDVDGNNSSFRSGAYLPMRYFINLGFKPSQLIAGMPVYGRPDNETVGEYWTNYYHDGGAVWADEDRTKEYTYWDNVQYLTYGGIDMKVYVTGGAMTADKTAYAIEQDFAGIMLFRNLIDYPIEDERSMIKTVGEVIAERIAH